MHLDEFIKCFSGVKASGGQYSARCPAHDDRTASLSIGFNDGRILLHCHAGCATADVLRAARLTVADLFANGQGAPIQATKPKAKIRCAYDYRNESGELVYQAVRMEPKGFRQRRPDGAGGWIWDTKGVTKYPYHLRQLLAADAAVTVHVVEGEKDADRLAALGLVATTNVGGAGKWLPSYSEYLRGHDVVILPDNDDAGREHAQKVTDLLAGIAASVKVVELPNLPLKGDVSDWLDGGGTIEMLSKLIAGAGEFTSRLDTGVPTALKSDRRRSQATLLVEMAEDIDFFHNADGEAFATAHVGDHLETYRTRSNAFRRHLQRKFYLAQCRVVNAQALQDAIGVLEGRAIFEGPEHEVFVRLGEHQGKIYLDLADAEWRAVEIDAQGWRLAAPPIKFRRAKAMLALPVPLARGDINALRQFVNVMDEEWPLVRAALVAAVRPRGPYPILCLHGEQGNAKSTATRILRSLIDPNTADLRAEPKEPRDLMIAANNGWVIALDNLSFLPSWLSDALCRLSTGGGFATRTLFRDDEETIFNAQRPVILNGIEEVATRGDLIDRSLIVPLPVIADRNRRDERQFWADFEAQRPALLGALLTAVSAAIRNLPSTKLDSKPRMADFALWVTAAEPSMGPGKPFMSAYIGNRQEANHLALEASLVAKAVLELMEKQSEWKGTASDLLAELEIVAGLNDQKSRPKGWPGNARGLSGALKRLAPNMRAVGVEVELGIRSGTARSLCLKKGGTNHDNLRQSEGHLRHPGEVAPPENSEKTRAGDANDASDAKIPINSDEQPAMSSVKTRLQIRI